jgi:hypothetical protein
MYNYAYSLINSNAYESDNKEKSKTSDFIRISTNLQSK